MKKLFLLSLLSGLFLFTACEEDNDIQIIDTSMPDGSFVASRSGSFVAQSGTPTQGMAQLGTDDAGTTFLRLSNDFTTELGTGTVSVFFSTSDTFTPDPGNGNPDLQLVGVINDNGEAFYRIDEGVEAKFTHIILWCGTANIPFGNAALQ